MVGRRCGLKREVEARHGRETEHHMRRPGSCQPGSPTTGACSTCIYVVGFDVGSLDPGSIPMTVNTKDLNLELENAGDMGSFTF